jgi:hypothetical protein
VNDERAREINEGAGRKDREHIETDGLSDPEERLPALERLGILLELAKADGSVSLGAQFHYDDRFQTPGWPHPFYALLLTDLEKAVEGYKDLTTRIRGALAVIKEHGWGGAPGPAGMGHRPGAACARRRRLPAPAGDRLGRPRQSAVEHRHRPAP